MAAILLVVLFGVLSMTLLTHSIGHQRITRLRTQRSRSLLLAQDDLNMEMHRVFSIANKADLHALSHPAVELFSQETFPSRQTVATNLTHEFSFTQSAVAEMTREDIVDRIHAVMHHAPYGMEGEIQCRLLRGSVPFSLIPVLLKGELSASESAREMLAGRNVHVDTSVVPIVQEAPPTLDIKSLARAALNLGDREMTWSQIRSILDMPIVELPPPPGVYLIRDMEKIDAILVQGNLDSLGFSRTDAGQEIHLKQGELTFILEYEPEGTVLDCWDPAPVSTAIFSECIVVNGNCLNVCTMEREGDSQKAFHPDSDILLLITGSATITSSLESDHLGVSRTSAPGLTMVCGKSGILDQGESGIHMDSEEPTNMDTSLITSGTIFTGQGAVNIHGSLCSGKLENKGRITLDYAAGGNRRMDSLLAHNLCLIQRIFISRLEEVYNEAR